MSVDVKWLVIDYFKDIDVKIEVLKFMCGMLFDLVMFCVGDDCFDCLIFNDLVGC